MIGLTLGGETLSSNEGLISVSLLIIYILKITNNLMNKKEN